jgi:trimethylamine:corrinoid methyltransferase-like protein
MLREYYESRGWDFESGLPYEETLERLGLDYVAETLRRRYKLPRLSHGGSKASRST